MVRFLLQSFALIVQLSFARQQITILLTKSPIIPIPKKSDLSMPRNYRGISLTRIAAKKGQTRWTEWPPPASRFLVIPCEDIQHALINSRLKSHLEPVIRPNQNGFREGSSTLSQLLSLEELVKRLKKKTSNRKDTKIFIDFQKAFDSTDRF